jgi:hypothetical protein
MTLVSGLVGIFSHNTFRSAWIDMEWHDIDLFKASKKVFIPIIALLVYVNAIPSLLIFGIIYVFGKSKLIDYTKLLYLFIISHR